MHSDFRVSSITPKQREAAREGPIRLGGIKVRLVPTNSHRCSVGDIDSGTLIICVFFDGDACTNDWIDCPTAEVWLTEPDFTCHLKNQLTNPQCTS